MIDDIPGIATSEQLAGLFGITRRQVDTLTAQGVLDRGEGKRFETRAAIAAYLRFKSRGNSSTLEAEKIRLTQAQAQKTELQNQKSAGELVEVSEVRRAWVATAHDLRAALLAVPARVAANLSLDRAAAVDLDAEIRLALEVLADAPAIADPAERRRAEAEELI